MSILNFISALSFGILGLVIVLVLVSILVRSLGFRVPTASFTNWGLRRRADRLELLLTTAGARRLQTLTAVFAVSQLPRSRNAGDAVNAHNLRMLDRLIEIAELRSVRLHPGLAQIEGLLTARTELIINFSGLISARSRIERKRREEGKGLPEWSRSDFESRLDELRKQLAENSRELELALAPLLDRFRDSSPAEPITIQ